jgi:RNA polymerase sigma-70 factor (ECF subfamily)
LPKFRGDSSFGTWVGRIAVNVARDAATRRGRSPRPFSTFEDEEGEQFFDPPSKAPPPGDAMLRDERRQVVRRALACLPEHHRTVLVLFDLQGHAYEEVAAMLNLPLGTVKSRLNRARAALREALKEDLELFDVN